MIKNPNAQKEGVGLKRNLKVWNLTLYCASIKTSSVFNGVSSSCFCPQTKIWDGRSVQQWKTMKILKPIVLNFMVQIQLSVQVCCWPWTNTYWCQWETSTVVNRSWIRPIACGDEDFMGYGQTYNSHKCSKRKRRKYSANAETLVLERIERDGYETARWDNQWSKAWQKGGLMEKENPVVLLICVNKSSCSSQGGSEEQNLRPCQIKKITDLNLTVGVQLTGAR